MSAIEIVAGILLILASVIIVLLVLFQESKEQGLTSAIGGGSNSSFYENNMGRTKDARLSKMTKIFGIVLVVVTLVVNVLAVVKK